MALATAYTNFDDALERGEKPQSETRKFSNAYKSASDQQRQAIAAILFPNETPEIQMKKLEENEKIATAELKKAENKKAEKRA